METLRRWGYSGALFFPPVRPGDIVDEERVLDTALVEGSAGQIGESERPFFGGVVLPDGRIEGVLVRVDGSLERHLTRGIDPDQSHPWRGTARTPSFCLSYRYGTDVRVIREEDEAHALRSAEDIWYRRKEPVTIEASVSGGDMLKWAIYRGYLHLFRPRWWMTEIEAKRRLVRAALAWVETYGTRDQQEQALRSIGR